MDAPFWWIQPGFNKQSSEIVNEDGTSREGPQLPTIKYGHAIVSVNSTVSILTGGYDLYATNDSDQTTWYFNHATQKFKPGPNLLEGRSGHSSGTITDHETKEKIVLVSGGYNKEGSWNSQYLKSTEILLNGEWVTGKIHKNLHIFHFFLQCT